MTTRPAMIHPHDAIREHLLTNAGYPHAGLGQVPDGAALLTLAWNAAFVQLMQNRMIQGTFRYGGIADAAAKYDYVRGIHERIDLYARTGNLELLVDVANFALVEFTSSAHPHKHWGPLSEGDVPHLAGPV